MFYLPSLPYPSNALAPAISKEAVERHYMDNHALYIKKINELTKGTPFASMDLLSIALSTVPYTPINNNAAQAWAHDFWWNSMQPKHVTPPRWLNYQAFSSEWVDKGSKHFGSGWIWLVIRPDGTLAIDVLEDAILPQSEGNKPILVMDLWEHAYYCQYGTNRKEYLTQTLPLLNWELGSQRLRQ